MLNDTVCPPEVVTHTPAALIVLVPKNMLCPSAFVGEILTLVCRLPGTEVAGPTFMLLLAAVIDPPIVTLPLCVFKLILPADEH